MVVSLTAIDASQLKMYWFYASQPFRCGADEFGDKVLFPIVASTLVIAASFNPLRLSLQAFVDRRFYRRKYDARKTLEVFSSRLRNETDLQTLNGNLVGVVGDTMQPEHVSVWLRPDPAAETSEAKNPG